MSIHGKSLWLPQSYRDHLLCFYSSIIQNRGVAGGHCESFSTKMPALIPRKGR
jgi:hypothetical protein